MPARGGPSLDNKVRLEEIQLTGIIDAVRMCAA